MSIGHGLGLPLWYYVSNINGMDGADTWQEKQHRAQPLAR
jgi:hypothetical protein